MSSNIKSTVCPGIATTKKKAAMLSFPTLT
jgi:hypothetical protein